MKTTSLYLLSSLVVIILSPGVTSSPMRFEDERRLQEGGRSLQQHEEGRIFHAHALRKRKKKRLLHCLLNLQRSNPQGDGRTLFINYINIEYNQHGGNHEGNGGGLSNCLGGGGGGGGGDDQDGDTDSSGLGIGEGVDNLSSLVGQVGEVPGSIISSVGDGIKPVFENPEICPSILSRYVYMSIQILSRYVFRPLYRSLRPLYSFF